MQAEWEAQEEVVETPSEEVTEDAVEQAFEDLYAPEEEEVVASTESPEDEAPATVETQEPSSGEELPPWAHTVIRTLKEDHDLADALVALQQGKARLVPSEVLEAAQRMQVQPEEQDDFWNDPEAAYRKQREELEQVKAYVSNTIAQQRQAVERENATILTETIDSWRSGKSDLSDEQAFDQVFSRVRDNQLIAYHIQRTGDKRQAVQNAFDEAYRLVFPQTQSSPQQMARQQRAKVRAGGAAASPRTVQRARPEEPQTRDDKVRLIADIIREHSEA